MSKLNKNVGLTKDKSLERREAIYSGVEASVLILSLKYFKKGIFESDFWIFLNQEWFRSNFLK